MSAGGGYPELVAELFAARRFGVKLGLEPMRAALQALGHPERRVGAVLHVGGTNGKGSTCAFAEAMLREAGFKVGLYTSPHLARLTERFRVDGRELDGEALAALHGRARELLRELTFFEQCTLLALLAFAEAGTDVAILEVGLGGRLDATNAVDAEVAVVTGIALDHTEWLGESVESIAAEKAGIWKAGREAVVGASAAPAVRARLAELAREAGVARVTEADAAAPAGWALGLGGAHQAANAACALAALSALSRATGGRVRVDEAGRRRGLAVTRWPGRLELVPGVPPVLLDAAHNQQGAEALAAALAAREREPGRLVVVAGASADKPLEALLRPLVAEADLVIATEAPSERAAPAAEVARVTASLPGREGRVVRAVPGWEAALQAAVGAIGAELVVVFGSIFLVGAVRARLLGEAMDARPLQDPRPRP